MSKFENFRSSDKFRYLEAVTCARYKLDIINTTLKGLNQLIETEDTEVISYAEIHKQLNEITEYISSSK